ncbi:MAG: hypothetical protein HY329_24410, partial [Chloroflexi bacterium]|nr:hypothetical protein [Chloroflexota bacterium]
MATRSQTIVTRRPSLWPIVFALGLLVTAAFVGLPLLAPPLAPEPAPLRTIPHTDVNPYGANFFLHREVEPWKVEKTLALAREAGIGWGKQHFPWETVEPRKGVFLNESLSRPAWEKLDEIVAAANRHGIRLIVRLDRPPAWARSERPNPPEGQHPPTSVREYGDFVYAVVSRYRGSVQHYQIWNEPNLARVWGGRPPSADEYVELLK